MLSATSWLADPSYHILAIWSYLKLSEAIGSYLKLSGAIRSCLELSGTMWTYLELSGAIRSYLELPGTICSYLEPSGAIWSQLKLSGTILSGSTACSLGQPWKSYLQVSSFNQALLPDPGNAVLLSILNKSFVWGLALGSFISVQMCSDEVRIGANGLLFRR